MDEQSNRRLLLLIAGLILVVVTFFILTLKQFVADIDELFQWPIWLAVLFNVIVLVTTALIIVGHLEARPVAKFLGLVVVCKVVETVLTAAGFVLMDSSMTIGPALREAGLESLSASVLHVMGALVVARVLRDVIMGRRLGFETPSEGIILPAFEWPEEAAAEPGVEAYEFPDAGDRARPEGDEELDRLVATSVPAVADLEAMPDEAERVEAAPAEPPAAPAEAGGEPEVLLSLSDILECFSPKDIALSAAEVRQERGGDDFVRVPLDIIVPQLETGVVRVEPELIFGQLPRATFARPPEAIAADLWQGKIELPLARVVAQVPPDVIVRSHGADQEKADEFPDPFKDTLAGLELPSESAEPVEASGPEAVEEAEAPAPMPPSDTLAVSAEYVVAQFPEHATTMSIEDIEARLEPQGKLQVSLEEVLPQLAEGRVAVDVRSLLRQLPPGSIAMDWAELAAALPEGKVQLPLEEIVRQVPAEFLAPGLVQSEQEMAEEIPEPFEELPSEPVAGPAEAPRPEAVPTVPKEPAKSKEPPEGAEDVVEVPWLELLPQFPDNAFSVSREQLLAKLQGITVRMDLNIIRPQLGKGRVTVPCGYLLAQFPGEYLDLSIEEIAEHVPDARFEIPLPALILNLPGRELALPAEQALQETAEEIPTVFVDRAAQPPAQPSEEEAGEEAGPPPEPVEVVPIEVFDRAAPTEEVPAAEPEPVFEPEPAPAEEAPEPAVEAPEEPEPAAAPTRPGGLSDEDIAQLETLLGSRRVEGAAPEYEGEFVDDLFGPEEAEAPEAPMKVRLEPVQEPEPEKVAAEEIPEEVVTEAAPLTAGVSEAIRESEAFKGFLGAYSKYRIEHGGVHVSGDRFICSFTAGEISGEKLARELAPRVQVLERLAEQFGCGSLRNAVMVADKGAVICQWPPTENGGGRVLIATGDRQAAGVVHLQARRDTELLGRLGAEISAAPRQGSSTSPGRSDDRSPVSVEAEPCEMEQPEGHPYDTITGFLSGYDIRTVALLKFRSGGWWVLASSAEVEACGPSTEACYNPDVLVQWPEELGLGRVRWVLAAADHNVLTINAPRPGGGCGLVCVFPGGFREGLLKMKTDKASALLCEV